MICYASFKQRNKRFLPSAKNLATCEFEAFSRNTYFSNLDPANIEFENIYTDVTKRGIILNLPGDYQFSPRHSTGQPQEVRVLSKCVLSTQ